MGFRIIEYQETPNPNALKCILDRALPGPIRSFRTAAEAAGDPLGTALMGVPGVTAVLLSGGWMTVNKAGDAAWPTVKPATERVLREAGDDRNPEPA